MNPAVLPDEIHRFRRRLQLAIMVVVVVLSALVLIFMQQRRSDDTEAALHAEFQRTFDAWSNVHALRYAMLIERGRELVHKISRAQSRDAWEPAQLYAATHSVLDDIMEPEEEGETNHPGDGFHAEFYRYLDAAGNVIPPGATTGAGPLLPGEALQLKLTPPRPDQPQLGYMAREALDADGPIFDLIALPVRPESDPQVRQTLVLGFEPANRLLQGMARESVRGLWFHGVLYLTSLPAPSAQQVAAVVGAAIARGAPPAEPIPFLLAGEPQVILFQRLNVNSSYDAAYQVCLYPLTELKARLARLRWQVLGGGGVLLLTGLLASHFLAARFSRPVERLLGRLAQQSADRLQAEAALAQAADGMRRAARFSADASHQLKTPVAVLRAGLEEIRVRGQLTPALHEEIEGLMHQTSRLSVLIEDLLLLSRLDAGRLVIKPGTVDLAHLIDSALDDWSAQPDPWALVVEKDFPRPLLIQGEQRYVMLILQNLLDNARKYNRPHGRIRIQAVLAEDCVQLVVGNTPPRPITRQAQEQIFERFHRGDMAEDIPGYGLGLNLARELARLHGGDLILLRSDEAMTEFEVRLPRAAAAPLTV
jgi:signal transduction histidine kinase